MHSAPELTALTPCVAALALAAALAGCGQSVGSAGSDASPRPKGSIDATAACDAMSDPIPPDTSAAAKGRSAAEGIATREACRRALTEREGRADRDLARIREIKEAEQAELLARKNRNANSGRAAAEGAKQPLRDLRY